MIGIKQQEDKHYVYIPFVVYAESNVDTGPLEYQMSFNSDYSATFVKGVNVSGTISPGESRSGYLVYELPNMKAYEESQPRVFRSVGQVNYNPDLSNTIFSRKGQTSVGRGYSVSTSTLLPATEDMLEDTQFVLEKGINVALAAETGATVTVKTGSRARGALVFLYELAKSQVDTPPTSLEDIATSVSVKGIGSFQEKIQSTEDKIHEDIYGDGVVRPVGPTIIREN